MSSDWLLLVDVRLKVMLMVLIQSVCRLPTGKMKTKQKRMMKRSRSPSCD